MEEKLWTTSTRFQQDDSLTGTTVFKGIFNRLQDMCGMLERADRGGAAFPSRAVGTHRLVTSISHSTCEALQIGWTGIYNLIIQRKTQRENRAAPYRGTPRWKAARRQELGKECWGWRWNVTVRPVSFYTLCHPTLSPSHPLSPGPPGFHSVLALYHFFLLFTLFFFFFVFFS